MNKLHEQTIREVMLPGMRLWACKIDNKKAAFSTRLQAEEWLKENSVALEDVQQVFRA